MRSTLADIRPGERRVTWGAFCTLLLIVAGHIMLETSRDALFLSRLPASRLPFTYFGIAAVSLGIFYLEQERKGATVSQRSLSAWLVAAAFVTAFFWFIVDPGRPILYYALYVWSGVVSTLVVSRFWTVVGKKVDVGQARRLFPVVTLGGIVGAVTGSSLAGVLAPRVGAEGLLLGSACLFLVSGGLPWLVLRLEPSDETEPLPDGAGEGRTGTGTITRTLGLVHKDPYLRRIGILLLLSTVAFTFVDYLFKATVAREVPADSLGSFFARAYLVFNVLSLVAQLLLVRYLVPLVRRLKVDQLLSLLPGMVILGAGSFLVGLGLVASYALKAIDGTFRYSLHRTSTEMLFVPIAASRRSAIKGLLDVLGQRGGQALASVLILLVVLLPHPLYWVAALIILGSLGWMWSARSILSHYLDLFRMSLTEGSHSTRLDYPQMDLASMESLLRSLNSTDDGEVVAAIDLLEEKSRVDVVPALILYHPSTRVVLRALILFAEAGRLDILPLLDRLLSHEEPEIRAAALRARLWLAPDPDLTLQLQADPSPVVQAASWVGQVSFLGSEEARRTIEDQAKGGSEDVQQAIVQAVRFSPSPLFDDALVSLASSPSLAVRLGTTGAMREIRSLRYVPSLIAMLPERDLRSEARRTLVAIGPDALAKLESSLAQRWLDPRIRKHLPRSINQFGNQKAVQALVGTLPVETDPAVEHKILRALGRLSQERPELDYDSKVLFAVTLAKLRTAYRFLDYRVVAESRGDTRARQATAAFDLLVDLLKQKHALAVEHVFRLLGIANRDLGEDFRDIYRGAGSRSKKKRASARELLENILQPPLREPLLLLIEDLPPSVILDRVGTFHRRFPGPYEDLLAELLDVDETGVRCLVAYHIGELGLTRLGPTLEALPSDREGLVARSVEKALERMGAGV